VAEHIRLENEQNWSAVRLTMVQDDRAFYDFVAVGNLPGIAGVQQLYQTTGGAFSDLHMDVAREYDVPGCSIREGVITAMHTGNYLGIPASGNRARASPLPRFSFSIKPPAVCSTNGSISIMEHSCSSSNRMSS